MTARHELVAVVREGVVVEFAVERARRRGAGWSALEAELTEVPALELAVSGGAHLGGADSADRDFEQLSIFGGGNE